MLFFQLMTGRYEQASTVLTSNKGFEEWGGIFGDEVMAAALIDRRTLVVRKDFDGHNGARSNDIEYLFARVLATPSLTQRRA